MKNGNPHSVTGTNASDKSSEIGTMVYVEYILCFEKDGDISNEEDCIGYAAHAPLYSCHIELLSGYFRQSRSL